MKSNHSHIATFKTGEISVTYGQRKWLAREMSDEEIQEIETKLQATIEFGCIPYESEHLKSKIDNGELTFDRDVLSYAFDDFKASLIEYNETPISDGRVEHRVLLRPPSYIKPVYEAKSQTTVDANLCFVLCIDNLKIVTAYWNAVNDNHATLKRRRYCS